MISSLKICVGENLLNSQIFEQPVYGGIHYTQIDSIVSFVSSERLSWDENRFLEKLGASWAYIRSWGWSSRTILNSKTGKHERRKIETIYTSLWPIVIKPEYDDKEIIRQTSHMISSLGEVIIRNRILETKEYPCAIDYSICTYDN